MRARSRWAGGLLGAVIAAGLLSMGVVALGGTFSGVVAQTHNDGLRLRMQHVALDLMEVLKALTGPELEKLVPPGRPVEDLHVKLGEKEGLDARGLDRHDGQPLAVTSRAHLEVLSPELVGLTLEVGWTLGRDRRAGKIKLARIVRKTW